MLNPQTGRAFQVKKGEGFVIQPNTWHQAYNFTDETVSILGVIAPSIWSQEDRGSEIEYLEESRFYKVNLEVEGTWPPVGPPPVDGSMARVGEGDLLHLIHGKDYHVLVSLLASNQYLSAGFITLPTKGFSEPETHAGDEVVYAMDGSVMIQVLEGEDTTGKSVSHVSHEVQQGQKFLIPEGIRHQYFNFNDRAIRPYFAVAPRL